MPIDLPNHRYYRACHGAWRCALDFNVHDGDAFRKSEATLVERLRVRSMVWSPKLLGAFTLDTTLDYLSHGEKGEAVHTTRVSKWGFTVMRSVDRITLDPDGRHFMMQTEQRAAPFFLREEFGGPGEVDESGTHASYTFRYLGADTLQTGHVEGDRVTLTQESSWLRAVQRLKRVP